MIICCTTFILLWRTQPVLLSYCFSDTSMLLLLGSNTTSCHYHVRYYHAAQMVRTGYYTTMVLGIWYYCYYNMNIMLLLWSSYYCATNMLLSYYYIATIIQLSCYWYVTIMLLSWYYQATIRLLSYYYHNTVLLLCCYYNTNIML